LRRLTRTDKQALTDTGTHANVAAANWHTASRTHGPATRETAKGEREPNRQHRGRQRTGAHDLDGRRLHALAQFHSAIRCTLVKFSKQ
jgi:hypothetical protein